MEGDKEFTEQLWDQFLESSKNLTEASTINDVFSKSTSDCLLNETLGIFKAFDERARFRIWVDGQQRDDLNDVLMKNPPLMNDTLESWTTRMFGQQKFGIIFNHGECWNKNLNVELYKRLKPLLQKAGYPMMGMDITVFVGNYGWTPLGIHVDHLGESVMHFHLGPSPKEMYIWDKEEYFESLDGKLGEKRPEFFKQKAVKHDIKEGGIFYMPWGKPHIGKTDELSMGISIWFNKPTRQKLVDKIIKNFNLEYISEGKNFNEEHNSFIDKSERAETLEFRSDPIANIFEEVTSGIKKLDFLNSISYTELLAIGTKDYQYMLKSCLGFSTALITKKKTSVQISETTMLSVDNPYRIEYYFNDITQKIHLFIKGQKLMMNFSEDIKQLLERLNTGKIFQVQVLLQDLFTEIPKEVPYRLIEILYENNALDLQHKQTEDKYLKNALVAMK